MSAIKILFRQLKQWCLMHPRWALLILLSGWLVALLAIRQQPPAITFIVNVLTSLGTVAAAFAAFRAARLTQQAHDWQVKREEESKKPLLLASNALMKKTALYGGGSQIVGPRFNHRHELKGEMTYNAPYFMFDLSIELVNLCPYPIYILMFEITDRKRQRSWACKNIGGLPEGGFVLTPGQIVTHKIRVDAPFFLAETSSAVLLYHFQSSSTGHVRYCLPIPVNFSTAFWDDVYPVIFSTRLGHLPIEFTKIESIDEWTVDSDAVREYRVEWEEIHLGSLKPISGEEYTRLWESGRDDEPPTETKRFL